MPSKNGRLIFRRLFLALTGALILVYAVSLLAYVFFIPDIGVHCAFTPEIKRIDPQYFIAEEGEPQPRVGDELIQVGHHAVTQHGEYKLWVQVLLLRSLVALRQEQINPGDNEVKQTADGTQVLVKFRSQADGESHSMWCRLGKLPPAELVPSIVWFLIKFGLFVVGALVFWKRPADDSAAQFFFLCIVTLGAYLGGYHWVRISTQPVLLLVFMICSVLLPAASLHFYLVFPRAKGFLQRYPDWTKSVIYGPPLLFLAALVFSYFHVRVLVRGGSSPEAIAQAWSTLRDLINVYLVLAAAWYIASVVGLVHSYRTAADLTERNQVKWIMGGSMAALLPIGYSLYLVIFETDDFGAGAATWPMFAASVCITISFAVSFTRYRLMQLDQLVSSGVVYFLISSLAVLLYYVVVFAGMHIADLVGSQVSPGNSWVQMVGVAAAFLGMMLILDLVRNRFTKALDRRFYREKYQLDRTLRRMNQAIEQLVDPPTLARRLLQASADLLNVSRGVVYLREGNPPLFRMAGCLGPNPPLTELPPGSPLVETLGERGSLVAQPAYGLASDPAQRQLRFLGGEVAHALAHEGKLLALLILGPKNMGLYGADDLNLLAGFAQITALALESADGHRIIEGLNRDLNEKVEKISEQQRRILALQSQLMRQATREVAKEPDDSARSSSSASAAPPSSGGIIGSGVLVRQLMDLVRKVSATQSAVLIRGESGTGKELLARALHDNSARAGKSFVKVHCAALSPGLLESELFGHVKGAFTGAHRDKVGRFELAHGGTLFLDEIGDITLEVQTKLLRVLQEKTFERVGSSDPMQVDVRVIAATHQNLEEFIRQGRFREDLYYRLKVIDIPVPPLRERREDIPELAMHFLNLYAQRCDKAVTQIDDDALAALKSYSWPGNIRELENVMERSVVVAEGSVITLQELPEELNAPPKTHEVIEWHDDEDVLVGPKGILAEREERSHKERERLVRALTAARGNKAEAARALGLARSTLLSRLKKYGLS